MDPAGDAEARFVELEVRYTHLERQVTELSRVLFEQQQLIESLRKHMLAVKAQVEEQGAAAPNDRPPHY